MAPPSQHEVTLEQANQCASFMVPILREALRSEFQSLRSELHAEVQALRVDVDGLKRDRTKALVGFAWISALVGILAGSATAWAKSAIGRIWP